MNNDRYILLLKDQQKNKLQQIEQEFKVNITSSEELSSTNKAFNLISNHEAVFFQNLNILVVEGVSENQLTEAMKDGSSPIIYFEKEREFFPVNELGFIRELKEQCLNMQKKIEELESFIQSRTSASQMEWGIEAIGIDRTKFTGKGVSVCILDTGFDTSHPDFSDRDIEGKSFIENEDWDNDLNGHGTHCTGIAAGNVRLDNGTRYGIAKDANIRIGKVLSNSGRGTSTSVIDGVDWAISQGYRIISLSLGSPVQADEPPSPLFEAVGKKALESNCLIIAAAGNDSNRPASVAPVSAPANVPSVMAVAAIDKNLQVAYFSNAGITPATGGEINVCAPGVNIFSSFVKGNNGNDIYANLSGTSMAAPHVSGLTALYMEQFPEKSAAEIWELLEQNAKQLEDSTVQDVGKGLIQAIS